MSTYTKVYGARREGDYGIAVKGRRATVVRNNAICVVLDENGEPPTETGRTGLEAAQKLAARMGWSLYELGTTGRVTFERGL